VLRNARQLLASAVTSKPKKKDNDRMTMKFLLHIKKKENGNPAHIQAHLAAHHTGERFAAKRAFIFSITDRC